MNELAYSVANLWTWLETWMDEEGGIHGYVVYHHRDNLKILVPDTWTQATCTLGLLELYRATREEKWLQLATKLAKYLIKTYIPDLHIFSNSNFDRKPLGQPALEGNALASYALLETSKQMKDANEIKLFQEIAKDNIMHNLIKSWDESVGAFISIYHGRPHHIHNKNSAVIMSLISLNEIMNFTELINKYALRTGQFIVNSQVKQGIYAGAYPYKDNDKNYRTTYTLITCLGLLKLYRKTKDEIFLISVKNALRHLSSFLDNGTGLICHYHRVGYPQWILDTVLFIMTVSQLIKEGFKDIVVVDELVNKVLSRQYSNGGFPISIGFEDLWYTKRLPSRPNIRRWRDLISIPGLNSWVFWGLSALLPSDITIPTISFNYPLEIVSDREETEGPFKIIEYVDKVTFETIREMRIVGIFRKKSDVADLSLIKERGDYWKTIDSIMMYPEFLRRIILGIPRLFL